MVSGGLASFCDPPVHYKSHFAAIKGANLSSSQVAKHSEQTICGMRHVAYVADERICNLTGASRRISIVPSAMCMMIVASVAVIVDMDLISAGTAFDGCFRILTNPDLDAIASSPSKHSQILSILSQHSNSVVAATTKN